MIKIQRINNSVVKPLKFVKPKDDRPIKGFETVPLLMAIIFICAHKNSGKTWVVNDIINKCSTKDTTVIAFVSTLYKDDAWIAIRKNLKKKGIDFIGHTSIVDDDTKQNHLIEFMKENRQPDDDEEDENEIIQKPKDLNDILFPIHEDEDTITFRKSKYQAPKFILIFDDLSDELRKPYLQKFLKEHRHYSTKVIISSQYCKDLPPMALQQTDFWLLFKGHTPDKLINIYERCGLNITFQDFINLYNFATSQPYNFLYINKNTKEFRRNFNERLLI